MIDDLVRQLPCEIGVSGQEGDICWYQLQLPSAANLWAALDLPHTQFAMMPYAEELEVLFVRENGLDRPAVLWRFDYVSQRPPQVQYVGHRPIHEHDTRPDPGTASLPEPISVLLDALEVDLV